MHRVRLPLTATPPGISPAGYIFKYKWHKLEVEGVLISHSAQNGAVVKLDFIEWNGLSICDADTYTFSAEN